MRFVEIRRLQNDRRILGSMLQALRTGTSGITLRVIPPFFRWRATAGHVNPCRGGSPSLISSAEAPVPLKRLRIPAPNPQVLLLMNDHYPTVWEFLDPNPLPTCRIRISSSGVQDRVTQPSWGAGAVLPVSISWCSAPSGIQLPNHDSARGFQTSGALR